jgi:hypothetical protein
VNGILCGHHRTFESLVQSAANRCCACRPLWEQLSRSQQESLRAATDNATVRVETETPTTTPPLEDFPVKFLTVAKVQRGKSDRRDFRFNIQFNEYARPTRRFRRIQGVFVLEQETRTYHIHLCSRRLP